MNFVRLESIGDEEGKFAMDRTDRCT